MGFSMNPSATTIYLADDRSIASGGGVEKWTQSSGTWSLAYTLSTNLTVGARGLAVDWSGSNPIIYISDATSNGNKLWTVADAGSSSGFSLLATAAVNTAFRGVSLAPFASCDFENGSTYTPPTPIPGNANNPIGRFKLTSNVAGGSLISLTVNAAGTRSGVNALKLYFSTQSTFSVGTSTFLASTTDGTTPAFTFSGQSIPTTGGYFFLVADVASVASGIITPSVDNQSSLGFTNALVPTSFTSAALSSSAPALPVELVSFVATANRLSATLSWMTATEHDNAGWEIEKKAVSGRLSADSQQPTAESWVRVGFVSGSGNSNATQSYSFMDENLSAGRYAYRLKQIDHSGASTYSYAAEVVVGVAPKTFTLNEAYPNPFNPSTRISFSVETTHASSLRVYNLLGQHMATLFDGVAEAGKLYERTFEAGSLPSGLYLVQLESGGRSSVKRLMLMK